VPDGPRDRGPRGRRRLRGPVIGATCLFALLIGLGVWQLQRLTWKEGILARIAAAEAGPASPLDPSGPPPSSYAKVRATGHFAPGVVALYGADVRDTKFGPVLGADEIAALIRPGGPPLLVDRGWVSTTGNATPPAPSPGEVSVEGYIRPPDRRGFFSPSDNLATRRFFTLDSLKIGAALGVPSAAPYVLVALGPPGEDGAPIPATHLPRPPNDHLSYAVTWFGLAAALLVMFVIWFRKARRA
jgi:surfeit locus 1 family protein